VSLPRALVFDVDGTLAETERDGHRIAFNQAFEALGLPWRWDEAYYGELLSVAGGRERLLFDMQQQKAAPADRAEREALAARVHAVKNECYARIVREGRLPLRPGVAALMGDCRQAGMAMAIATTTTGANVEALLSQHLDEAWRARFAAVICAEEAPRKKPDPQVYQLALAALGLCGHEVVAFEDSPAGITAARRAGLAVIVTRSCYFPQADDAAALAVGPSLGERTGWRPAARADATRIDLEQIGRWYAAGAARPGPAKLL
jgi:HAD superfamily hydrolase (TIGR01509 family)